MLEEKRYNSKSSLSQKDTHGIIDQLLQVASGTEIKTVRGKRPIEYRGYYLIQFEKTNPEDSQWIKINGKRHTTEDLLFLLQHGYLVNLKEYNNLPPPIIIGKLINGD